MTIFEECPLNKVICGKDAYTVHYSKIQFGMEYLGEFNKVVM